MENAILLLRNRQFFGANIVNLPAIYLTKKYAQAKHLQVISGPGLAYFYQQVPWVSQHTEAKRFYQIYKHIPPYSDFLYSMRPSMDSVPFLKRLRHIDTVIGFSLRSKLLNRLYDFHQPCDINEYRAITHIRPLISYLSLPHSPTHYMREALLALADIKTQPTKPHICIMPGAGGGKYKKWGIEKYWQLMLQLQQQHPNLHFEIIVGSDENDELNYLARQPRCVSFSVRKNLPLKLLIQLIERSQLTIANDCGPSHISQCLAKPFIGLYPSASPEWFHEHDHSHSLVASDKQTSSIPIELVLAHSLAQLG